MSNQNPKIKKIINTLSEGTKSLKDNPSEQNRREWEDKIEQAGNSSNWTVIIIVGVAILVIVFSFTILSGGTATTVPNSSTTSNSSHPSDAVYFNNHYYKNFIYPSSMLGSDDGETSLNYATTTCNSLNGYMAIADADSEETEFMAELYSQFEKEHPDAVWFVCEWDN